MTYSSRLRAKTDSKHPSNQSFPKIGRGQPSDEVVEEDLQRKLQGGFERNRRGTCPQCFMKRTTTGTCNCDEPTTGGMPQGLRVIGHKEDRWLEEE